MVESPLGSVDYSDEYSIQNAIIERPPKKVQTKIGKSLAELMMLTNSKKNRCRQVSNYVKRFMSTKSSTGQKRHQNFDMVTHILVDTIMRKGIKLPNLPSS